MKSFSDYLNEATGPFTDQDVQELHDTIVAELKALGASLKTNKVKVTANFDKAVKYSSTAVNCNTPLGVFDGDLIELSTSSLRVKGQNAKKTVKNAAFVMDIRLTKKGSDLMFEMFVSLKKRVFSDIGDELKDSVVEALETVF